MRPTSFRALGILPLFGLAAAAACSASSLTPGESNQNRGAAGRVSLTLIVPEQVRAGVALPVTLRLTNNTQGSVQFVHGGFADRIYFDVAVTRSDGSAVWNHLHGRTILLAAHTRTLTPGEVIELEATWNLRDNAGQPVGPGTYRLQGKMLGAEPRSTDDIVTERKMLTVVP